jgi:pimeloyl-ACP methyl ester carboxylesterase
MAVDKSRFPHDVLEIFRRNACEPGALTAMLNYYRAVPRSARLRLQSGFPRIDVPTLMIWGERDTALGKELTYGTDQYVDNFTLRYLPNVSHWVQQEAPEAVNAMLEAWLEGRPVPEAPCV